MVAVGRVAEVFGAQRSPIERLAASACAHDGTALDAVGFSEHDVSLSVRGFTAGLSGGYFFVRDRTGETGTLTSVKTDAAGTLVRVRADMGVLHSVRCG